MTGFAGAVDGVDCLDDFAVGVFLADLVDLVDLDVLDVLDALVDLAVFFCAAVFVDFVALVGAVDLVDLVDFVDLLDVLVGCRVSLAACAPLMPRQAASAVHIKAVFQRSARIPIPSKADSYRCRVFCLRV